MCHVLFCWFFTDSRLAEDTLAYTVQSNDTLTSLAARFDTTPSELVAINKLHSRLIFPGQVIDFIPPPSHRDLAARSRWAFSSSNEIWPGIRGERKLMNQSSRTHQLKKKKSVKEGEEEAFAPNRVGRIPFLFLFLRG
jgi:LysM repeat protein